MKSFAAILLPLLFCLLLSLPGRAWADEDEEESPKKPSAEQQIAKIVRLGPGVHAVKKDKKGRIVSCVVVGQSRISTALGKAKGIELARGKANLDSSAQFVKWLKEEVSVYQSAEDESVIMIEGSEGGEEDTLKESGKSFEKQTSKIESTAKGLVRGMQLLHKDVDGDGKFYTVVKGWRADTANGVKRIAATSADDSDDSAPTKGASKKKGQKGRADKAIESDSETSDDAADFFPQ